MSTFNNTYDTAFSPNGTFGNGNWPLPGPGPFGAAGALPLDAGNANSASYVRVQTGSDIYDTTYTSAVASVRSAVHAQQADIAVRANTASTASLASTASKAYSIRSVTDQYGGYTWISGLQSRETTVSSANSAANASMASSFMSGNTSYAISDTSEYINTSEVISAASAYQASYALTAVSVLYTETKATMTRVPGEGYVATTITVTYTKGINDLKVTSAYTADHATWASYANEAQCASFASTADYASNADYATSAGTADSASSANYARYINSVTTVRAASTAAKAAVATNATNATFARTATLAFNAISADNFRIVTVSRDYSSHTSHTVYTDAVDSVLSAAHAESADVAGLALSLASTFTRLIAASASYFRSVTGDTDTDTAWVSAISDARSASYATSAGTAEHASTATLASTASYVYSVRSITDEYNNYTWVSAIGDARSASYATSAGNIMSQTGAATSDTAWVSAIGDARSASYATSAGTATYASSASSASVAYSYTNSASVSHAISALDSRVSVNESHISENSEDIGDTSLLDTTNKSSLVAAVNEIKGVIDALPTGLVPRGTIAFSQLPSLTDADVGDMYNISDDFTTTSDFVIPGINEKAGSNVYCCLSDSGGGTSAWNVINDSVGYDVYRLRYFNGKILLACRSNIFTSTDEGDTWSAQSLSNNSTAYDVAYDGQYYYAIVYTVYSGYSEYSLYRSIDSTSWIPVSTIPSGGLYKSILCVNNKIIAVGRNTIAVNTNEGLQDAWTVQTITGGVTLLSVTYGDGIYCAVGVNGAILTSTDAITWTQQTSGVATILRSVTYGDGIYCAVGDSGVILTSTDTITWTQQTSSITALELNDIIYDASIGFYAVGSNAVIKSADCVTWETVSTFDYYVGYIAYAADTQKMYIDGYTSNYGVASHKIYMKDMNVSKKWDVFAVAPDIVVDQTYSPDSQNPQSGTAVAAGIQSAMSTISAASVAYATSAGTADYASTASYANTAASFVSSDSTYAISNTSAYITSVLSASTADYANSIRVRVDSGTEWQSEVASVRYASMFNNVVSTELTTALYYSQQLGSNVTILDTKEYILSGTKISNVDFASKVRMVTRTVATTVTFGTWTHEYTSSEYSRGPVQYVSYASNAGTAASFVSSDSTYAISDTSAYISISATSGTSIASAAVAAYAEHVKVVTDSAGNTAWQSAVNSVYSAKSAESAGYAAAIDTATTVKSASSADYAAAIDTATTVKSANSANYANNIRIKTSTNNIDTTYTTCVDTVHSASLASVAIIADNARIYQPWNTTASFTRKLATSYFHVPANAVVNYNTDSVARNLDRPFNCQIVSYSQYVSVATSNESRWTSRCDCTLRIGADDNYVAALANNIWGGMGSTTASYTVSNYVGTDNAETMYLTISYDSNGPYPHYPALVSFNRSIKVDHAAVIHESMFAPLHMYIQDVPIILTKGSSYFAFKLQGHMLNGSSLQYAANTTRVSKVTANNGLMFCNFNLTDASQSSSKYSTKVMRMYSKYAELMYSTAATLVITTQ